MESKNKFEYTYFAPTEEERREIEDIRKQFLPQDKKETEFDKLRRLNAKVNRPPKIVSSAIGIFGTLLAGLGFAMVTEWNLIAWGVAAGVFGIGVAVSAYPVFKAIQNRNKRKYGKEILRLSDEILKGGGAPREESASL